jgi:large subunit ribosomal protein L4
MKLKVVNGADVEVNDQTFGREFNEALVHQVVVAYMNAGRAGTKAQKTRAEVSGGGRKPWRQKGTGRSRQGSRRSPIWVGGGITFGPRPRRYTQSLSRRERALALRSALSAQARTGKVVVVDPPTGDQARTRDMAALLRAVGAVERPILVTADGEWAAARAAANIRGSRVLSARRLSVRHLLVPGTLVLTRGALAELQEALGP